jgi:hypothetical protein
MHSRPIVFISGPVGDMKSISEVHMENVSSTTNSEKQPIAN